MEEPLHRSGAGHAMAVGAAVTVVCSLPLFLTVALPNQLGDEFGFGPVGIGAAVAVFFGTVALTSLHLGRVADGAGTVTSLRTAALGAASASTYIALVASSWIELAASLVVAALAAALAQPATNRLLADRIPAHRLGMAFGLKQSAPPVASMLAGLSVPVVALTIGWRWGYALAAVGAIAAAFAVGPRPARAQRPCRPRRRDRSPLGARPTLVLLVAGFGLAFATNSIVLAFYVEAAIRAGSSHQFAGSVLAGASLVAVMTRLVAGAACDRYAFDPLRLCALLLGVGAVGLVFLATGRGELMALGAVLGLGGTWGFPGVFWFALVRAYVRAPGRITGVIAPAALGGVFGPLGFGALATGVSFAVAWNVTAMVAMVAAMAMLMGGRRLGAIGAGGTV